MASVDSSEIELLVRGKVEDELKSLAMTRKKDLTKTAKDVIESVLPEVTRVIMVAVSAAVNEAMKQIVQTVKSNSVDNFHMQRQGIMLKYECDKLEQYQRSDNLRIYGLREESGETEEVLEDKVIELASKIGVDLQSSDISVVHRLGKPRDRDRPLIVRFCRRKRRNEILKKKAELKKQNTNVFINEDLTPLRSTMMKMVKDQTGVKNATSRNGKIVAWLSEDPNRAIEITTPDDLNKVGIVTPDWKRLKLDQLVWDITA